MSKYEEICEVAANAREEWIHYRERCWASLGFIVNGLMTYCGIPSEQITFLRWNGLRGELRKYAAPEHRGGYTLLGATSFDEEDGYWHLGICITVSPVGTFPQQWVSFAICVTEHEQKPVVKVCAVAKSRQINLKKSSECTELYDDIVEKIKQSFDDPHKTSKTVGFTVMVKGDKEEKQ